MNDLASSARSHPRDVVIFVPGLGDAGDLKLVDQSAPGVARRIAAALDRNATDPCFTFRVDLGSRTINDQIAYPSATILRALTTGKGVAEPVLEFVVLNYQTTLVEDFEARNPISRALILLRILVFRFPTLLYRTLLGGQAKTHAEKGEFLVAVLVAILLSAYLVLVFLAAGTWITTYLGGKDVIQQASERLGSSGPLIMLQSLWDLIAPAVRTSFLAAAPLIPASWRSLITHAALLVLSVCRYVDTGQERNRIRGVLAGLIEKILEDTPAGAVRVHLLAYSFGSIIVLDTLFPIEATPDVHLSQVQSLVTIGAPFDLLRLYWPAYFANRHGVPRAELCWINLWARGDVFGSNFRDNGDDDEALVGLTLHSTPDALVPASRQSVRPTLNVLYGPTRPADGTTNGPLGGFRIHTNYWGGVGSEEESSCFTPIVRNVFADLLSAPTSASAA